MVNQDGQAPFRVEPGRNMSFDDQNHAVSNVECQFEGADAGAERSRQW